MLYRVPRPPFSGPPFFQPGPYRPPTGRPGGGPGREPGGDAGPPGRPPSFTPEREPTLAAVDPGAIRRCRYKFTYLWLKNRRQFWAYLTFVGRTSVAGYRWTGYRWVYFGTDLRNIESFVCH